MQGDDTAFFDCGISPLQSEYLQNYSQSAPSLDETHGVCIVCMDREKDIALKPCGHTSCCATCFIRLESRQCPTCRSPTDAAHFLGTDKVLSRLRICEPQPPVESSSRRSIDSANPYVHVRQLEQSSLPSERRFANGYFSTASSLGSIATQAASSMRPMPSLRSRGFEDTQISTPARHMNNMSTSSHLCKVTSQQFPSLLSTEGNQTLACSKHPRNVVLLGQSKMLMMSLLKRLRTIFPPPTWADAKIYQKNRFLLYVQNEPMRLVLVDPQSDTLDIEYILSCIRQYSPRMILLCANFFNLSSFESVVRLDLEVFDFVNVPCMWVLIKNGAKENKLSNKVEHTHVSAAKHFVASPRRCFIATVDAVFPSEVRKLGLELHFSIWRGSATHLGTRRSSPMRNLNLTRPIFRKQHKPSSAYSGGRCCFNFGGSR